MPQSLPLPPSDLSPTERNRTSMAAFWRAYGLVEGGLLREAADHALMLSGVPHPLFNNVLGAAPADPQRAAAMVAEVQAALNARGLPLLWWTLPDRLDESGLATALTAAGAQAVGATPAMELDLAQLPTDPLPPGLNLHEVGPEEFALWAEIAGRGTDLPPEVVQALREREPQIPADDGRRRFLARLDDAPVGTVCTIERDHEVGVFAVAVLAEHRRRGLGAAITLEPLRAAAARGCRVAQLQASPLGEPVYRRLGFVQRGEFRIFLQLPQAPG